MICIQSHALSHPGDKPFACKYTQTIQATFHCETNIGCKTDANQMSETSIGKKRKLRNPPFSIITAPFTSTFFWMDNMTSNSNSNSRFWETAAVSHPLAWPHTWCQANSVYSHTLVASDTCQVTSRDQHWPRRPERHQDVPQSLVHQPSSAQGLGHPARDPRHRHGHFEPTQ